MPPQAMAITHSPTSRSPPHPRSFGEKTGSCLNNSQNSSNSNMNGNRSSKEYHIQVTDQISKDDILDHLEQAKQNPQIVKLEMEDLLTSGHQSLLPNVTSVLTCDERDWKRIKFMDTVQAADFQWWQDLKTNIMRDYEESLPDHLLEFLTVQAQIRVQKQEDILPLLKKLPQDEDIVAMEFKGDMQGIRQEDIPHEIVEQSSSNSGEIVIAIVCGWQDEEAEEDTGWIDLCAACKDALRDHQRQAQSASQPPSLTRNQSAPVRSSITSSSGRETPVRMPSRRMQRNVSRGDVEEAADQINPKLPPMRSNTDPGGLLDDDDSAMDASSESKPTKTEVPRMPSRGVRRGTVTRQTPERAKSMGVMPSRSASAADRLALLGASGSRRVGSRLVSERTNSRGLPERSASGRRTPTRTSSRKVHDGGSRSPPRRANSSRAPPARSSSRKVSRQEEQEAVQCEDISEGNHPEEDEDETS